MDEKEVLQRAHALVSKMTLEEAASQLRYDAPEIKRLGIPSYNWWNEALHGVARAGTATVFPQAITMACSFSEELVQEVGDTVSTEARAKYNLAQEENDHGIYKGLTFWSPNINIFRDPRWGRGHETYGEDPYLTAELGLAYVKGLQGEGKYLKSAACAKHFAVHSGPENIRHEFDAVVSKKDLEETYLSAFERLVKEGHVESIMGAYNRVNGEVCCGSPTLLKDILRKKWGFQGHVVSDCWAISDFHMFHHITDTAVQSAALAIQNGCDLNCGVTYLSLLLAHQEGLVKEEDIRKSAERLMATRIRLGMMDDDCVYDQISVLQNDTEEHNALAYQAALKSMVLLKNDGILPLNREKIKTIAVIGPNANSTIVLEGNYAGKSSRYVTFLQGIKEGVNKDTRVLYALGTPLFSKKAEPLGEEYDRLKEAVGMAKRADVVILCVGLDATIEGEQGDTGNSEAGGDKVTLELPEVQRKLIAEIQKTGTPFVTVVSSGSALRVEEGNAVLFSGYPGQAGGTALQSLLFGDVAPSGKLPITFYHNVEELPDFKDYAMKNRTYRYFEKPALYPFGYGLSYTTFEFKEAVYAQNAVQVRVTNTGKMAGDTVIQCYIKAVSSPFAPLNPRLCAFKRVHLEKGESKVFTLPLEQNAFIVYNDEGEKVQGGNAFTLYVGEGQNDARTQFLTNSKGCTLDITL